MERAVSFPDLGLEFALDRVAFSMGPLTIYWYGLIVVTGMTLGLFYLLKRSREFGLHNDHITDICMYSLIAAIIGARAYYVIFSWDDYKNNLGDIIKIWEGGIAIYGGIIAAFIMGYFLCKRYGVPFLDMSDVAVGGLMLGQSIGRWGNFVNIEAFGANTDLPWGMTGPSIVSYLENQQVALAEFGVIINPTMPVHPTFFYESAWNIIGFMFICWYTKRRKFNGEISLIYAFWYGLGRGWIEGLRTDSLMWGSIRVSQALALVVAVLALGALIYLHKKAKDNELPKACQLLPISERHARIGEIDAMIAKKKTKSSNNKEQDNAKILDNSSSDELDKGEILDNSNNDEKNQ